MKGRLTIKDSRDGAFWLRVFKLEDHLTYAQQAIGDKTERKWGAVPIIYEHVVHEDLIFLIAAIFTVDVAGIREAMGLVYMTDQENEAFVRKDHKEAADKILELINKRGFDEVFPIEPGKEFGDEGTKPSRRL